MECLGKKIKLQNIKHGCTCELAVDQDIAITEEGASRFVGNGTNLLKYFWLIWDPDLLRLRLIGLITMETMSRETAAGQRCASNSETRGGMYGFGIRAIGYFLRMHPEKLVFTIRRH